MSMGHLHVLFEEVSIQVLCPLIELYVFLLLSHVSSFCKTCYLFIFRERGNEGEREGEKCQLVTSCTSPYQGPGLQPRHVPQLEYAPTDLLICGTMPNQLSHTGQGSEGKLNEEDFVTLKFS